MINVFLLFKNSNDLFFNMAIININYCGLYILAFESRQYSSGLIKVKDLTINNPKQFPTALQTHRCPRLNNERARTSFRGPTFLNIFLT